MNKRTDWRKPYETLIAYNKVVAIDKPYKKIDRTPHKCLLCDFGSDGEWLLSPHTYLRTPKCPNCAKYEKYKIKTKEYKRKLRAVHGVRIKVLESVPSVLQKVKHKCTVCLTVWFPRPVHTLRGHGCPVCHLKNLRAKSIHSLVLNGECVEVQGFEDFAVDYILNRGIPEDEIVVASSGKVPTVKYRQGGKLRKHFPDLYLPKQNRIIEVKSLWTFGVLGSSKPEWFHKNQLKKKAAIKAGFKYTLLVFTSEGNRIRLPKQWQYMSKQELLAQLKVVVTR